MVITLSLFNNYSLITGTQHSNRRTQEVQGNGSSRSNNNNSNIPHQFPNTIYHQLQFTIIILDLVREYQQLGGARPSLRALSRCKNLSSSILKVIFLSPKFSMKLIMFISFLRLYDVCSNQARVALFQRIKYTMEDRDF